MSERQTTVPDRDPTTGGERRRLDRAPGERYAARGGGTGPGGAGGPGGRAGGPGSGRSRRTRAIVAAALVADAGAVLFFLLGLLDLGIGLLAIAAFLGWVVGLALTWWGRDAIPVARGRVGIAALLGAWSVVAAIFLDWVVSRVVQEGVLGPFDYVAQRYELWGPASIVVAALVAAARAR
jgi:hypothetical protein